MEDQRRDLIKDGSRESLYIFGGKDLGSKKERVRLEEGGLRIG